MKVNGRDLCAHTRGGVQSAGKRLKLRERENQKNKRGKWPETTITFSWDPIDDATRAGEVDKQYKFYITNDTETTKGKIFLCFLFS